MLASHYYDLAGPATDGTLQSLRQPTTLTHILFSSDYPFTPDWGIQTNVEGFRSLSSLST